eukprot:TRINITY_DN5349_c0_g1_i1.p1 TRINITY_DN5349_c0_g1~~TRINITY_DN5349_c0_g1_i1.p1  ORF type:complete len:128 (-),score=17.76 TRINITY_DN5349_c0_g1_i1:443-826(-)
MHVMASTEQTALRHRVIVDLLTEVCQLASDPDLDKGNTAIRRSSCTRMLKQSQPRREAPIVTCGKERDIEDVKEFGTQGRLAGEVFGAQERCRIAVQHSRSFSIESDYDSDSPTKEEIATTWHRRTC